MSSAEVSAENPGRLATEWEARCERNARRLAGAGAVVALILGGAVALAGAGWWWAVAPPLLVGPAIWSWSTRSLRRRRRILAEPFPPEWDEVLVREVAFFRALEPADRQRFRRELQIFLGEKRITGVRTQIDATTRVLAGTSAIIPIFGFPEWEWHQIREVLIYPSRFDEDFSFQGDGRSRDRSKGSHRVLGMVGTGAMNGMMILAKNDLLHGFRNANDKQNVGLHEFAHLVDKSDGTVDGLPQVGLDRQAIGPWLELVRREMAAIESGESDLDPYALTNEAEFFAVATEYFFERPRLLRERRPELYEALARVFRTDLAHALPRLKEERQRRPGKIGRNDPCPCGSGEKYKRCCLRKRKR